MPKKYVAIMDITSSKISVFVGSLGINNTFFITGRGESEYAGFLDGEFLEPEKLELVMGMAISNAEATSGQTINLLYIGVPSDFSFIRCFEKEVNYNKKKTIKQRDLDNLNLNISENNIMKDKTIISSSPIWYALDDNRRIFNLPYKVKSSKLKAKLSLIYVEDKFIKTINAMLSRLNIKSVEYISTSLAEAKYLLSKFDRDKKAIIIDSDYISTSVIEVWGNGLMALNAFSIGGGHITADLSESFNLDFSSAEKLKNNVILSISSKRTDHYEIFTQDKTLSVPINSANEIILSRIKMIGTLIKKCLQENIEENSEISAVYLTGSGLSYINGAREYLGKYIGMNINLLLPSMPSMAKPHFSSSLSVLYIALKEKNNSKRNWIKKILNILFKKGEMYVLSQQ